MSSVTIMPNHRMHSFLSPSPPRLPPPTSHAQAHTPQFLAAQSPPPSLSSLSTSPPSCLGNVLPRGGTGKFEFAVSRRTCNDSINPWFSRREAVVSLFLLLSDIQIPVFGELLVLRLESSVNLEEEREEELCQETSEISCFPSLSLPLLFRSVFPGTSAPFGSCWSVSSRIHVSQRPSYRQMPH